MKTPKKHNSSFIKNNINNKFIQYRAQDKTREGKGSKVVLKESWG